MEKETLDELSQSYLLCYIVDPLSKLTLVFKLTNAVKTLESEDYSHIAPH